MIGELDGSASARIQSLADLLSKSLPTTWTENVMGQLWSKLIRNWMFKALGAIRGLEADRIARHSMARPVALALGREAVRVATAQRTALDTTLVEGEIAGFPAEPGTPEAAELERSFKLHFGSLPGVRSSTLQDALRGRREMTKAPAVADRRSGPAHRAINTQLTLTLECCSS